MAKTKTPKLVKARYGIAEWYGHDISTLTSEQRQHFGQIASDASGVAPRPICPFFSNFVSDARCNKAGGVCSLRKYELGQNGAGIPVQDGKIVVTCPSRFLQEVEPGKSLFKWVSQVLLGVDNPLVVKETPFLRSVSDVAPASVASELTPSVEDEADDKKAGRIDWIVLDPQSIASDDPVWSAVETQALYFSGDKMLPEFLVYAKEQTPVLFPQGKRRPDYRSSGPKRLSPQLDVKVPVLRNWGKKVAVIVDRFFFENMNRLEDSYRSARNDKERLDNAEVVWFIVDFDKSCKMFASEVIYTTLDGSRKALNATEPLSKGQFTTTLKEVLADTTRLNKVFRVLAE